jgi:hypothetical protein
LALFALGIPSILAAITSHSLLGILAGLFLLFLMPGAAAIALVGLGQKLSARP